jgi:hypothetical protein
MHRLLQSKFFAGMDAEMQTVSDEEFKELSPGLPIPKEAIMLGPLPDHLKALLCLMQRRVIKVAAVNGHSHIDDFDEEELEPYASFFVLALAAEFSVTPDFDLDYDDHFNVYKFRRTGEGLQNREVTHRTLQ